MKLKGQLKINVYKIIDGSKILIDSFDEQNMITLSGKQLMTFLMAGEPGNHRVNKIGVGTDPTLPKTTDIGLQNTFIKSVDGYTILDTNIIQLNFQIGVTDANGLSISEFGLFSQDEQLFSRKVRNIPIEKDDSISIDGDWTIWLFECKSTSFKSWTLIQTAITNPTIDSFNAIQAAPSIVSDITATILNERHFTVQSGINWDITSAMSLPFAITANIAFGISSDLEFITHRTFSVEPGIIFEIESDIDMQKTWQFEYDFSTEDVLEMVYDDHNNVLVLGLGDAKIYVSIDGGANWTLKKDLGLESPPQTNIYSLIYSPNNNVIIAGTYPDAQLWKSTDGGNTWTLKKDLSNETPAQTNIYSLGYESGIHNLVAGTWPDAQIWLSNDDGDTWTLKKDLSNETPAQMIVNYFTYDSVNDLFIAGTVNDGQIWLSTDSGDTWTLKKDLSNETPAQTAITSLVFDPVNEVLIAGTFPDAQIWISSDGAAATWTLKKDLGNETPAMDSIDRLFYNDSKIYAGVSATSGNWAQNWISSDGGLTWTFDYEFTNISRYFYSIAYDSNNIIAGIGSEIWSLR